MRIMAKICTHYGRGHCKIRILWSENFFGIWMKQKIQSVCNVSMYSTAEFNTFENIFKSNDPTWVITFAHVGSWVFLVSANAK